MRASRLDIRSRPGRPRRAGRGTVGAAGGGPAADLVALVAWNHAYWTEGDNFQALGLADAASVTTWPDEVAAGGVDLVEGVAPSLVAADADFNGHPIVSFDPADSLIHSTTITACRSFVAIAANVVAGNSEGRWHDAQAAGGGGRWIMGTFDPAPSENKWQFYLGTTAFQTADADTAVHLMRVLSAASGNDKYEIDGGIIYDGSSGASTITRANIGHGTSGAVRLAFLGFKTDDVTTDPGWSDFKAGAADLYNLTVA